MFEITRDGFWTEPSLEIKWGDWARFVHKSCQKSNHHIDISEQAKLLHAYWYDNVMRFNPIIAAEDIPCMGTWCFLRTLSRVPRNKVEVYLCAALIITSPPEGVARYCFHPVCLCVCVRPIFWYFISQLLEEMSIWNWYRILIGLYPIH